jgi:hypothetical protein
MPEPELQINYHQQLEQAHQTIPQSEQGQELNQRAPLPWMGREYHRISPPLLLVPVPLEYYHRTILQYHRN